jgi:SAM-dependent methyltransferase
VTAPAPSAEPLLDLFLADVKILALKTALELGVFDQPSLNIPDTGWDPDGARRLLDALVALRLLDKDGYSYRPTPMAARYLAKGGIGEFFLHHTPNEGHRAMAAAIRAGQRQLCRGLTGSDAADLWSGWAAMKRTISIPSDIWQQLRVTPRDGLRVLDVACGAARFSLALARAHPGIRLWLQDWPEVLEGVRSSAPDVAAQIEFIPGGLDAVDFGRERVDIVWIGHILHYFDEAQVTALLGRAHAALAPGGVVVLHEDIPNDDRTGDEYALLESLWLYAASAAGDVRTLAEWRRILGSVGFGDVEQIGEDLIRAVKGC